MQSLGPPLLALLIASGITAIELVTSEYSSTFFTVYRCPSLYLYSLIYGTIALIIVALGTESSHIEVIGISNPWLQAVIIGLSIKAVFHIRLFSVTKGRGADPLPIGLETVVQIFEPQLKHKIEQEETHGIHRFLDPRIQKYSDPKDVRVRIMGNLSRHMTREDRVAFKQDLDDLLNDQDESIFGAMQLYLAFMGKKNLDRIFPL